MNSGRTVLWRAVLLGLFIGALIAASATSAIAEERRPRVFITNSESWEVAVPRQGGHGGPPTGCETTDELFELFLLGS